jgi:hypothetical protein
MNDFRPPPGENDPQMIRASALTVALVFTIAAPAALANPRVAACLAVLAAPQRDGADPAGPFLRLIEELVQTQKLSDAHLERVLAAAQDGRVINPVTDDDADVNSEMLIYRRAFDEHLASVELDAATVRDKLSIMLETRRAHLDRREVVREETAGPYRRARYHTLSPAEFTVYQSPDEPVEITLTHSIAVSDVLTTQAQWFHRMGANPARHIEAPETTRLTIDGQEFVGQPDNPVVLFSWWSGLFYLNALSEAEGLTPAYNVDHLNFSGWTGKAVSDSKDLFFAAAEGRLGLIIGMAFPKVNAPGGNIYLTEGYRYPTTAEQMLLRSAGKTQTTGLPFDKSRTHDYEWIRANSGGFTQPVGRKLPLMVQGKPFFDVFGNVREMSSDPCPNGNEPTVLPGKNPFERGLSHFRQVARGDVWAEDIGIADVEAIVSHEQRSNYGLRPVRTLNPRGGP